MLVRAAVNLTVIYDVRALVPIEDLSSGGGNAPVDELLSAAVFAVHSAEKFHWDGVGQRVTVGTD